MPLRVLHVTNHLTDAGGAEVSLIQLLPHLQAAGIENFALPLTRFEPTRFSGKLREAGVVVLEGRDGSLPSYLRSVRMAVTATRPDVVHSTLWDADLATRLATWGTRVPVVNGVVNAQYSAEAYVRARSPIRLRGYQEIDGLLARRLVFAFHALTQGVADAAVDALRIDPARICVIPRGRDPELLGAPSPTRRERARRMLGIPRQAHMILNLARQQPQKGLPLLVSALAEMVQRHPNVILVQAGRPGADSAEIQRRLKEFGLQDHVRFLGRREDVGELLAAADLFVLSSLWEGQGGSLIEAMALGIACVAFDIPPVRETLGPAGTFVRFGDPHALAEAATTLLKDDRRRNALGRVGQQRFRFRYEIGTVAQEMAAFYEEVHDAFVQARPPLFPGRAR